MGQEIVYCHGCQSRLIGADFDRGKAFRVEHKSLCADCAKKILESLPPRERDAFAARMGDADPRRQASQKIPAIRSSSESGSHARLRAATDSTVARGVPAAPKKSSSAALYAGAGLGGAALVLLLVVLATGGKEPPAKPGIVDRPKDPPPTTAGPRDAEVLAALEQALQWAQANPSDFDGQLDRLQKVAFRSDGTAVYGRAKNALETARERAHQTVLRDALRLDEQIRGASPDAARRILEEARRRYVSRAWEDAVRRRLDGLAAAPPADPWVVLDIQSVASLKGVTLDKKADGSILVGGANPLTDVLTVTARSPLKAVAALRIEALADPTLPAGGPGRGGNGNFVLSELRVEAGGRLAAFAGAGAGFEQADWPASAALDGNPLTGWGVMPRFGQNSEAYFHAREPFDGTALTITLEHLSRNHQHVIGRFRLSVSAAPLPAAPAPRPVEQTLAAPPLLLSGDGLAAGWNDFSWDAKVDFKSAAVAPFHGERSISYQPGRNGAGFYVGKPQPIDVSAYAYLSFAVYRQDEAQFPYALVVVGDQPMKEAVNVPFEELGRPIPRQWTRYVLPLHRFRLPGNKFRGVVLQGYYGKPEVPAVHLDEIQLLAGPAEAPPPAPVAPHVAAYRARWVQAAGFAAARELDAALKALQDGAVPEDLKKELTDDLADLQLVKALHEEIRTLLAKWPRGWNLAAEILDENGKRIRLDEPVLRVDGQRLDLRGGRILESGRILAASLAELFLARPKKLESDARAAALLCLFEGDTAAAKRFHPAALPDKAFAHAAGAPDDAEARRLYAEAETEYAGYATRARSFEKFAVLLKDHAAAPSVRRLKASLQARIDGPRDFVYGPGDLAASGKLLLQRHAKGEIAWTMTEDVAGPQRKEHALDLEYSAPAGAEVRGWILVGGCCQETFAFHLQGTDVEGPDPENPSAVVKCDVDGAAALPVLPAGVNFLRKTHQAHGGGRKETARFDWVALPPLKRAGPGTQARLRLLADQQGFAVAAVVLSTTRKQPPKEAEIAELLAARPFVEPESGGFGKTGGAFREVWTGISGDGVGELTNNPKYKGAPDRADRIGAFESSGLGDSYGIRVRAWLVPPQTGNYVFQLISDDSSELWVSSDDTEARRQKLLSRGNAIGFDDWNGSAKSGPVALVRGRRYYVEAFLKQGGGGEHLRVGWQLPDGSLERPIPAARLIAWTPGLANRPGAGIDAPHAAPVGTPVPVAVTLSGIGPGARVELFNGPQRLGEPKGSPLAFTWAQPALGAHVLSARITERGGRVLVSAPAVVVVGDLHFFRAFDLNGGEGTLDDRPWSGASVGGQGLERQDVELRPPTDAARAKMIRSSVTGKLVIPDLPGGKYLLYATCWEPGEPHGVELSVNGKPAGTHKFAATGDWARLGPFAAEAVGGRIELGVSKGQLSGLELWSHGALTPTRPVKTDAVGGGGGAVFEENPEGAPLLVGFRLTQNNNHVRSLQGLYRQGERLIEGQRSGNPNGETTELLAKPGYAVGGLRVRGGDRVRAFKVVFMRIAGPLLSTSDAYESDWYCGDESGTLLLAGDGYPVVGLHGRRGNDLDALGLTTLRP